LIAAGIAAGVCAGTAGAATPTVREFSTGISGGSSPLVIAAGPDGSLWFTETDGNRIGRITLSGAITQYTLPNGGSGPNRIVAGPDGNLWFTEFSGNRIGRITPSGTITEYTLPNATSGPYGIVAGPDGHLWFTEFNGNRIGQINPTALDPATTIVEYPLANPNREPTGIAAGADGNLWFTETDGNRIGRINPSAPNPVTTIEEYTPSPGSIPDGIVAGPDGDLWFAEFNGNRIGRITPTAPDPAATFQEYALPTPGSKPNGIVTGADGNLWFTEQNGNRVGRINTEVEPPRYTDTGRIEVPAAGTTSGKGDPYPATIEAAGLKGTVTKVTVRLNGVHHAFASDVDAQLVGPQGQSTLLVHNATNRPGDIIATPGDVLDGQVITLTAGGPTAPRTLTDGIFAPVNGGFALNFPAPAPASPTPNLSAFNGTNPNGVWKLFVADDQSAAGSTGVIAGGWSLDIETTGPDPVQVPGPTVTGPTVTVTVPGPTVEVPAPADTTKPTLKLAKLATRTRQKAFSKGVTLEVTPGEPVTLDITLAVGALNLYDHTTRLGSTAAKNLRLKPSSKLLGKPRKTFKTRLRIVATDNGGNRTTVTRTIKVLPDK
jgi:streptogramin lyase/subtilisin-like proprotein convertase family protein